VISGDSLITTWMSNNDVYISSANLNDQQIGTHRKLSPMGLGVQNYPIIAGKGDTLAIVWQNTNAGTNDIFFTYSVTGTAGLGVNIDTLTSGGTGSQTRPDIQFSNGKFHVVYSDNVGSNVKYLQGTIDPNSLGLSEPEANSEIEIFTVQTDGQTVLQVKSDLNTESTIQLVNSAGQQVSVSNQQISQGISTISIPGNIQKGIYFVVLETKAGAIYKQKIII
jgi:hypothetical protein